jgi:hypothetical protein
MGARRGLIHADGVLPSGCECTEGGKKTSRLHTDGRALTDGQGLGIEPEVDGGDHPSPHPEHHRPQPQHKVVQDQWQCPGLIRRGLLRVLRTGFPASAPALRLVLGGGRHRLPCGRSEPHPGREGAGYNFVSYRDTRPFHISCPVSSQSPHDQHIEGQHQVNPGNPQSRPPLGCGSTRGRPRDPPGL